MTEEQGLERDHGWKWRTMDTTVPGGQLDGRTCFRRLLSLSGQWACSDAEPSGLGRRRTESRVDGQTLTWVIDVS